MGRKCATNVFLLLTSLVLLNGIPIRRIEWTRQKKDNYWGDFTVLEGDTDASAQPMIDHSLPPQTVEEIENITMNSLAAAGKIRNVRSDPLIDQINCKACESAFDLVMYRLKAGDSLDSIVHHMITACNLFSLIPPEVCDGLATSMAGEVYYVMRRISLTAHQICGVLASMTCGYVRIPQQDWTLQLPDIPKPPLKPLRVPKEGAPTFKVLQIADTHFDPYYVEGSNADCGKPMCCRISSGPPKNEKAKAGKWGDYRKCDIPNITIYNMYDHINRNHPDIDYILLTGDLVPHDVWNLTREENLMSIQDTMDQMRDMFPNVPVFPSVGNHEAVPVNSEMGTKWLYDALAHYWLNWLPPSTYDTVRKGAFYSVLVRPGFRIISLNTNQCYNLNWWNLIDSYDPDSHLQWFIYELQNAEYNNEKVHVIGHVPPGMNDCIKVWSRNYYNIISRYESTITAQFFGHTHRDEYEVFLDAQNLSRATSIAFIAPAITPYHHTNPSYRIYYVDGDHEETTRTVIDHETWIMDLDEANKNGEPTWYKEYSMLKTFNMKSLNPQEWVDLTNRMRDNKTVFDLYYKFHYKSSPVSPKCDEDCKKRKICDTRSSRSYDSDFFCKGFFKK